MKNRLWLWIPIVVVALLVVPAGRILWFYRGVPLARPVATPDLSGLQEPPPVPGEFVDAPEAARGVVLVDQAHGNLFTPDEITILTTRLVARGADVRHLEPGDDLTDELSPASAFVVICPGEPFTLYEIGTVRQFVDKGGRLLLIADPTRFVETEDIYGYYESAGCARFLNPLATAFGLTYEEDFLYNVVENEGNFQNILLQEFHESPLTENLSRVAFYSTHSIRSHDGGLILADGATRSSISELDQNLAVAALGEDGQVLALGDLTFMTSPYASVLDNGRLISQIADFLVGAERYYELADFPYYFGDEVDLVPVGSFPIGTAQVLAGSKLQEAFLAADKRIVFQVEEDTSRDTLFIGFFDEADALAEYLDQADISIEGNGEDKEAISPTLTIADVGEVDTTDMALLYRHQEEDRQVLILLADTGENLELTLDVLAAGKLAGCLMLSSDLALCAMGEAGEGDWGDEEVDGEEPVAGTGILVVSDDDLYDEPDCFTSEFFYYFALYEDYEVDTWYEYDQGNPTLADLQEYAVVIWSIGSCHGLAPDGEDAETLREYVAGGGRLLIEGMSIGADWSGTPFYEEVCHAEAIGAAEQVDLEVVDADHPLAQGFSEGEVIDFEFFFEDLVLLPDVIVAASEAQVVFARGPQSEEAGADSILVYEGAQTRVVYIAFPLYLLSEDAANSLILNAVEWLLEE